MSEEFIQGLDTSSEGSEWAEKVSEQAQSRVREDLKNAANTRSQIKKQWKRDQQNAKLLSLLLQYINDDGLLHHVFHQLVDLKIEVHIIVAEFLPILQDYISLDALAPLYSEIWELFSATRSSAHSLVWFYKNIYTIYNDSLQGLIIEERRWLVLAVCRAKWCAESVLIDADWSVWTEDWLVSLETFVSQNIS